MDLPETWRALEATEELRRAWHGESADAVDVESWEPVPVPGHWRSVPAFAASEGPLLYRTSFDGVSPKDDDRWWLELEGVFYQSDIWLDGAYVGDTEGYFFPHSFEVTGALRDRSEHVLGVEVACPPPRDKRAKRNLTGVFQHWDCLDPDWNPGGIWRPVRLVRSGPVRIRHVRVLCLEAGPQRAVVRVRAVLDACGPGPARVCSSVGDVAHEQVTTLAAGENQLEWDVTIAEPELWWPHALGGQHRYDVHVAVTAGDADTGEVPDDAPLSDERRMRTGLRQVRLRNWVCSVNGERLFLKGANQGPTRMALGECSADELERDVHLAVDAGLDLLRLHAHVSRPELYDAADDAGLLLWQDFPLQWGYARGVRRQAVRQAREMVDLLGHHPSVAIWCGHNEPLAVEMTPGGAIGGRDVARFVAGQALPSWNKTILDRSVKRAIGQADPSRAVIAHSGVLPHPPQLDGTDTHLYFGWYHGEERDLPRLAQALPRLVRFVTEFGAQAVPDSADFMEPERWPDLDWERLGRVHALQKAIFDRRVPPADHASFAAWQQATQTYQAEVIRHHVETLRRLKYRPTGGFCQFSFADGYPAVTWSVLDHARVPKTGYVTLAEACRPVIVVADRLPEAAVPGDALALDVHVVSDRRHPLEAARVETSLQWEGGRHDWAWVGDVPVDGCVRVGTVQAVVPHAPGVLRLDLSLVAGDDVATNRYETSIVGPGRAPGRAAHRRSERPPMRSRPHDDRREGRRR